MEMKRNWDTIRRILMEVEALDSNNYLTLNMFNKNEQDEIYYHIEILIEASLIEGEIYKTMNLSPHEFHISRLSWQGHEFLDGIRADTMWSKIKSHIKSKGIDLGFEIIKTSSLNIAKNLIS